MNTSNVSQLLNALETLLLTHGETNWVRGVAAARQALKHGDGEDHAKSIYLSMNQGPGSFADYNVWHEDPDVRRRSNAELDKLRAELWSALEL